MGKKHHTKDRAYLTTKEWKEEWGGHKAAAVAPYKRLPFHCCAIAFTPWEDPVCTEDGLVMDILHAVPYVQKLGRHPVSGQPLGLKDLIKLTFHKNGDGEYCCPVLGKVFTEHSHIVAVKTSGQVYSWEAVDELCVKPKSWRDLMTDVPFTRKDIIHIQDPLNLAGREIARFDHVQRDLSVQPLGGGGPEGGGEGSSLRSASEDVKRVLGALAGQEAKDSFARGGGGGRAEAARLLADAQAAAAKAATATGSGSAQAAGEGGPAAGAAGGGDWRLQAPAREARQQPTFKPGAVTWDTDDHSGADAKKGAKGQAAGDKQGAPAAAGGASSSGRPNPQAWYKPHVRYVESVHTTGAASRSFTSSTYCATQGKNERQLIRLDRNPPAGKKAYARLSTNFGDLNLELHADLAPRTVENFLALCAMGYYTGTTFHRSIKNFMIQGGDPAGDGTGGESIYGPTFKDELDSRLTHTGRGVLSMANSGPNTNGSQFFITYKSCRHLDFKHSVFGRLVGGLEVLAAMERVPVDARDRPVQDIVITGATVFVNPFMEMEEAEKEAEEAAAAQAARKEGLLEGPGSEKGRWWSGPQPGARTAAAAADEGAAGQQAEPAAAPTGGQGVGKYITALKAPAALPAAAAAAKSTAIDTAAAEAYDQPPPKKAKLAAQSAAGFGNFDSW